MKSLPKSILLPWLLHFAVMWLITVGYAVIAYLYNINLHGPYLQYEDGSPVSTGQYLVNQAFRYDVGVLAFALLLAEINYHFLFKKVSWTLFVASCIAFAAITFAMLAGSHLDYIKTFGWASGTGPVLFMALYVLIYALIRDYFYQYNLQKDLHLQQSQNELDALKAQLNPHFLFNSLNYLYGTALKENAGQTADGIDMLSELLRYTINGIQQNFVPLNGEIHFIKNYLGLQRVRLPNRESITVTTNIDIPQADLLIAPMLLLTFIENAFKHGISMDEFSYVNVQLEVQNGWLLMQIVNSIVDAAPQLKSSRTGLANTRKRLELLYANRYVLELNCTDTRYSVILKLHLHTLK